MDSKGNFIGDKDMKIINYFLFVSSSCRCVDHVIHKDG